MLLFYTCTVVLIIKARDESQTVYSAVFFVQSSFLGRKRIRDQFYIKCNVEFNGCSSKRKLKKITRVRICPF